MEDKWRTTDLPADKDYVAPDGSEIRLLLSFARGGVAHCTLPPGALSTPKQHRTVEEIWYFLEGRGEVWRREGNDENVVAVYPGRCIAIEQGVAFQFRNTGEQSLQCLIATMPKWPGPSEAEDTQGKWDQADRTPVSSPVAPRISPLTEDVSGRDGGTQLGEETNRRVWSMSASGIGPDHLYWKLAEEERHFNTIQAGLRSLASAWLLGTFAALGFLMRRPEDEALWVPAQWLLVVVCVMGATGLALLWVLDQYVYQRLLGAVFYTSLKVELDDPRVPPIRAAMMVASRNRGMRGRLTLFYSVPIVALGLAAEGVSIYYVATHSPTPHDAIGLLLVSAAVPLALLLTMYVLSARHSLAPVESFADENFCNLVKKRGFADIVAKGARQRQLSNPGGNSAAGRGLDSRS